MKKRDVSCTTQTSLFRLMLSFLLSQYVHSITINKNLLYSPVKAMSEHMREHKNINILLVRVTGFELSKPVLVGCILC